MSKVNSRSASEARITSETKRHFEGEILLTSGRKAVEAQ